MTNLTLVEVRPGKQFTTDALIRLLGGRPKRVVKFAKLYRLTPEQLGALLRLTCPDVDIVRALTMEAGEHSASLQGYIVELGYEHLLGQGAIDLLPEEEEEDELDEGLLAEMFEQLEVKIADEIADVADTLTASLNAMPGKEGRMKMRTLLKLDRRIKRKLGVHEAGVHHAPKPDNLVVFDVSGSMGEHTVTRIVAEVAALAVKANAHLAIVSDTARYWERGTFSAAAVQLEAEYGGTHYETLVPLLDKDWGVVVTIADFDSSWGAKEAIKDATGRIGLLLDISLVERPTFLAECLSQLADETRPLLVSKPSVTHKY